MRMFTKEEIKELFAETNKAIAELAVSQKKTDEQQAKTEKTIDRLGAKMDKMNEMYGGLSNNVGSATEEFFYNALKKKRTLNGIRFDRVERNWGRKGGKQNDEFDIVMLTPKASPGDGTAISVIALFVSANNSLISSLVNILMVLVFSRGKVQILALCEKRLSFPLKKRTAWESPFGEE